MQRCRAFSRVDVLVGTAIVVLLTAFLLPAVGRARTRARRTACMANAGQIQKSLQKYTIEWIALLPFGLDAPSTDGNFWTRPLGAYLENAEKIRQCPEAAGAKDKIFSAGSAAMPWNQPDARRGVQQRGAYTINGWLYEGHFAPSILMGEEAAWLDPDNKPVGPRPSATVVDEESFYRLPLIHKPETVPTFADAIWSETFPAVDDPMPANLESGAGPAICFHLGQMCIARHGRAVNVAFFDGHVETVGVEQLWKLNWQAQWVAPEAPPVVR